MKDKGASDLQLIVCEGAIGNEGLGMENGRQDEERNRGDVNPFERCKIVACCTVPHLISLHRFCSA